tara:strand:+ start:195 stop:353 length:159 start_codon:yes stop_codon:yes gene_type:complete
MKLTHHLPVLQLIHCSDFLPRINSLVGREAVERKITPTNEGIATHDSIVAIK